MKRTRKSLQKKILELIPRIVTHPEETNTLERLEDLGFVVTPGVAESFKNLALATGFDANTHEKLAAVLVDISQSPAPGTALLNFLRYLDKAGSPAVTLSTVAGAKPLREMLAIVFATSQYMADIIIRNPGYVYWLIEKLTWERLETTHDYLADVHSDMAKFETVEARLNAVRRFQRRAMLKVGVQDLMGYRTVEETTLSLSRLADATCQAILDLLLEGTTEFAGIRSNDGFAVLALGKLGGAELNYSSDIDLIYVCDDDENLTLYTKLARKLTAAMADVTAEGYLYRVDLRLRPDGRSGPLVSPVQAIVIYYENRALPWEFQAMLKARVIAGNNPLGDELLERIAAMTFSTTLSYSPIESVALMRQRIRDNISVKDRVFNIKLMEGGIRDIEFILQAIQLTHGAKNPNIRTGNTLQGIQAARRAGLIKRGEGRTLTSAYRFFRVVEHRLQMMHQVQTHSIPEADDDIGSLSGRVSSGPLGEFSTDEFLATLTNHINSVRVLSDSFFANEDVVDSALSVLFPDEEHSLQTLSKYNLADPQQALAVLQSLAQGTFPHLVDRRTRGSFQQLLPKLLEDVMSCSDPNQTLINFASIAGSAKNPGIFYDSLSESAPYRTMIRDIAAASPFLTRKLAANLDRVDELRNDPGAVATKPLDINGWWRAILSDTQGTAQTTYQRLQSAIDYRVLAAWVVDVDTAQFPDTMARTTSTVARDTITSACGELFADGADIALFALGSFAVGEPRPGSDIDLLVVASGGDVEPATRLIHTLNRIVNDAGLYKLDFRLRGEGANAPLVQDIESYERYFAERMSPWEQIAYAKCSYWFGDMGLAEEFTGTLSPHLVQPPAAKQIEQLKATRAKLETLVKTDSTLETKRSTGGRYDIEYLCAIALAKTGNPFELDLSTAARIALATTAETITIDERDTLLRASRLYQRVDYVMELGGFAPPRTREKAKVTIRHVEKTLQLLGLGLEANLEETLIETKAAVRRCYDRVIAG